jgi:hypothetical protein
LVLLCEDNPLYNLQFSTKYWYLYRQSFWNGRNEQQLQQKGAYEKNEQRFHWIRWMEKLLIEGVDNRVRQYVQKQICKGMKHKKGRKSRNKKEVEAGKKVGGRKYPAGDSDQDRHNKI